MMNYFQIHFWGLAWVAELAPILTCIQVGLTDCCVQFGQSSVNPGYEVLSRTHCSVADHALRPVQRHTTNTF